jgi:hypothetical protein
VTLAQHRHGQFPFGKFGPQQVAATFAVAFVTALLVGVIRDDDRSFSDDLGGLFAHDLSLMERDVGVERGQ